MEMHSTGDFRVRVPEGEGHRLAAEVYAMRQIAQPTVSFLSSEGPRVRREPARPAANLVTQDVPCLGRACRVASR